MAGNSDRADPSGQIQPCLSQAARRPDRRRLRTVCGRRRRDPARVGERARPTFGHARVLAVPERDGLLQTPGAIVWQFEDPLTVHSRVLSLAADDFECSRPGGRERCVPSRIALSPDGQWLVVSFEQAGQLLVVPLEGLRDKIWLNSKLEKVQEIAFSHDGSFFAAGGCCAAAANGREVHQVRLWTVNASRFELSGLPLTLTSSLSERVQDLAFATDEQGNLLLLSGGLYGIVYRWDLHNGRSLEPLRANSHDILHIAFSRGGSLVATADDFRRTYTCGIRTCGIGRKGLSGSRCRPTAPNAPVSSPSVVMVPGSRLAPARYSCWTSI